MTFRSSVSISLKNAINVAGETKTPLIVDTSHCNHGQFEQCSNHKNIARFFHIFFIFKTVNLDLALLILRIFIDIIFSKLQINTHLGKITIWNLFLVKKKSHIFENVFEYFGRKFYLFKDIFFILRSLFKTTVSLFLPLLEPSSAFSLPTRLLLRRRFATSLSRNNKKWNNVFLVFWAWKING